MRDPALTLLYSREAIAARVRALAQMLSQDFAGREPIVIGVLKGAFMFVADLVRALTIPVQIDFLQVASYGSGRISSGTVQVLTDLRCDIRGQDVILVDTVLDTGFTLRAVLEVLAKRQPRALSTCVLLDKRGRRQVAVQVDYVGFTLTDGFVVGYGLDHAEAYRHLDSIYLFSPAA
ncbi:MAG: hypoxanthine phosphoribosyltransferase [Candidatus Binatia bacterium]|nr:hypoxanthine phosphoribosyltransferase [Candidatus Binatia bacterium]